MEVQRSHEVFSIAVLGLSGLGNSIASRLAGAGHGVAVYDPNEERGTTWLKRNPGSLARTPAEAVEGASIVICMGADEQETRRMLLGPQSALVNMGQQCLLVDHSAVSEAGCETLALMAGRRNVVYLDATLSGGMQQAEKGLLTVMVGGDRAAYDQALVIFQAYCSMAVWVGAVGAGQAAKRLSQGAASHLINGLSQALEAARERGLPERAFMEGLANALSGQLADLADLVIYESQILASEQLR